MGGTDYMDGWNNDPPDNDPEWMKGCGKVLGWLALGALVLGGVLALGKCARAHAYELPKDSHKVYVSQKLGY